SPSEIIGKPMGTIVPDGLRKDLTKLMKRIKAGQEIDAFDTVRVRKDGAQVDVAVTISPIRDKLGSVIGAAAIARDIGEKKLAHELEKKLLLMEQNEEFMATLSHDLKNPLLGINRVLELFAAGRLGALTAEQKRLILQVRDSNHSLLSIIQDLI